MTISIRRQSNDTTHEAEQPPSTSIMKADDQQPFRFLDLPTELRLMVYEYLCTIQTTHYTFTTDKPEEAKPEDEDPELTLVSYKVSSQILQVSRLVKREAQKLFEPQFEKIRSLTPRFILDCCAIDLLVHDIDILTNVMHWFAALRNDPATDFGQWVQGRKRGGSDTIWFFICQTGIQMLNRHDKQANLVPPVSANVQVILAYELRAAAWHVLDGEPLSDFEWDIHSEIIRTCQRDTASDLEGARVIELVHKEHSCVSVLVWSPAIDVVEQALHDISSSQSMELSDCLGLGTDWEVGEVA